MKRWIGAKYRWPLLLEDAISDSCASNHALRGHVLECDPGEALLLAMSSVSAVAQCHSVRCRACHVKA
eukprot:1200511-Amphidinium_carterae.1